MALHDSTVNARSPRKVLILGCGYLGRAAGRALRARGIDVTGWVRSVESAGELPDDEITPWIGDIAKSEEWEGLPTDFDTVIHCASSGRGGAEVYRSVYLEGVRQALAHFPSARLIVVSSTSVYGQNAGERVDYESPALPTTETGQILRATEDLAQTGQNTIILRVAGIYGPGRGVLLNKFLSGEAVIEGDGKRFINQVHRDDIVTALLLATDSLPGGIYDVCDNEPVTYLTYYEWLSKRLGRPMPPFGPVNPNRKRGLTNKRVSNAKLRAAGWTPKYPTFREGLDNILNNP